MATETTDTVEVYQGDAATLRVTITEESTGDPPSGGTSTWKVNHALKADDDDTTALVTKANTAGGGGDSECSEVPIGENPDSNKWDVFYDSTDTDGLDPGRYVHFTKVTTDADKPYTILRGGLLVKAKGVPDTP